MMNQRNLLPALVFTIIVLILSFLIIALHHNQESGTYKAELCLGSILIQGLLFVALYRLTLHPLSRYPGPWIAALTDWYTVYHCLLGDRHIDFYRLHAKYGSFVRFGPNRVSVNTNTALQAIYSANANTQKSQVYNAFGHFFKVPATMTTIDRKTHSFKRRVTVQALSNSSIKKLEEKMLTNIRLFCALLIDAIPDASKSTSPSWSSGRNMTKSISYVLSDIMGDITFSRNWDTQRSDENRYIMDLLPQGTCGINILGHMPALVKLSLDKLFLPKLFNETKRFQNLSKAQSEWRLARKRDFDQSDLFSALLKARDPETSLGYTNQQLVAEAGILIVAGSDTTATSLTATIFYLLHSSSALYRLQEEIRSLFGDVEEIRIGSRLTSCDFLFACIDEAMRLSPSVGAILPRKILPGGLIVDGEQFPEGIDIGVPTYSIHHKESFYPEPFTFKPERWLLEGGNTKTAIALAKTAFCPFGIGRTSCIGKHLAYQEMAITLGRLVWLYDMRISPGSTAGEGHPRYEHGRRRINEFQLYDKFVSTHEGPIVEFKPRLWE